MCSARASAKSPPICGGRRRTSPTWRCRAPREQSFGQAALTLNDVDCCEFYDCFTAEVLFQLEDYGFCKKGEGGPFVESGAMGPGGSIPVNTSGGLLSCYHLGDLTGMAESIRQLRGEAGERQIKDCNVVLTTGHGGELDLPRHVLDPHQHPAREAPVSKESNVIVSNEPWKKPLPNIDKDNEEFYEGLKKHKFLVWRCKTCGASYWPKAYCINHENEPFAANMEWAESSGRGKIFAFNRHHMAFHPGFKDEIPYVYALIELDEGPLVSSTLVGSNAAEGRLRRRPESRGRLRGPSGGRLHAAALPDRGLSATLSVVATILSVVVPAQAGTHNH